jgi:2-polyprenyl-3-methyl-5-hydroxy-6-metoxy-1,4-benzoquinol methylase
MHPESGLVERMSMKGRQLEQNSQLSRVQSHFVRHSETWRDLYSTPRTTNELVLQDRLNCALDMLSKNVPPDAAVLDVGCGAGSAALKLAQMRYSVQGVDIAPNMIALCRKELSRILPGSEGSSFVVGDFMEIEFDSAHFDAVVALGFLEYQLEESPVLYRLHRIMKTGGLLIISGPQTLSFSGGFGLTRLLLKLTGRRSLALHSYGRSRMNKLLSSAGFEVKDIVRHGFAMLPTIEARLTGFKAAVLVHKFLTSLSATLPIEVFANDIVVAAIKRNRE